ncbi:hypothetical protein B0H16DRAFT_1463844 [Mycena metata]|uniref:Uncharacterized protein n=1 Tax=Mycena metata TaxID=1033252 RepID=A0AAD7N2A2_9AGAR|nr:hypothetical protein B0H16DRAFT_1463844 [Mycena metata]
MACSHGKNAPPLTQSETSDQMVVDTQIIATPLARTAHLGWTEEEMDELCCRSDSVPTSLPCLRVCSLYLPWNRASDNAIALKSSEWLQPSVHPVPRMANSQIARMIAQGKARPAEDNNVIRWNNPFVLCTDKAAMRANTSAQHSGANIFRIPGTSIHSTPSVQSLYQTPHTRRAGRTNLYPAFPSAPSAPTTVVAAHKPIAPRIMATAAAAGALLTTMGQRDTDNHLRELLLIANVEALTKESSEDRRQGFANDEHKEAEPESTRETKARGAQPHASPEQANPKAGV